MAMMFQGLTLHRAAAFEDDELEYLMTKETTAFGEAVMFANAKNMVKLQPVNQLVFTSVMDMRTADITYTGLAGYREGNFDQEGKGSDVYQYGVVLTMPEEVFSASEEDSYEVSFDYGMTFESFSGKEIPLTDTSVKLHWKELAVLKDGTICDLTMTLDNFTMRLLPGQSTEPGQQYLTLYAERLDPVNPDPDKPIKPEDYGISNPCPCACIWQEDGVGTFCAGLGFDVTFSFAPSDGSSLADHGVEKMIYYFMDLDQPDMDSSGYLGPYAESIEYTRGLIGPVYLNNVTYRDLYEYASLERDHGEDYEDQDESYSSWYDESGSKIYGLYGDDDTGRLLNVERVLSSKGTWYSASHHVSASTGYDLSLDVGLICIVDPNGFTFRWRGCMI